MRWMAIVALLTSACLDTSSLTGGVGDTIPVEADLTDNRQFDLLDPKPDLLTSPQPDLLVTPKPDLDDPPSPDLLQKTDLLVTHDLTPQPSDLLQPTVDLFQSPDLACSNCTTSNPCMVAKCVSGMCLITPVADGNSCSTGTGKCYSGSCCTGCWNGMVCLAGNITSACGGGGSVCSTCSTTDPCKNSICTVNGQCVNVPKPDLAMCPSGQCFSGSCCTGCWDGSACQTGTSNTVCGSSGSYCSICNTGGNTCITASCSTGNCQFSNVAKGTVCGTNMACDGNGSCSLSCGLPGLPCCSNSTCNTGAYCNNTFSCGGSGFCVGCGGLNQPCCCPTSGNSCTGSFAKCNNGLSCTTGSTNGCNGVCK